MYTDLRSFQQAEIIHDVTVAFCEKYVSKFSRTTDQMTQAARSGKQNIAEGCSVGKTDLKGEIKLLNIARGSLKELLEDYHDYVRQHGLQIWDKDDPRAIEMRQLAYRPDKSDMSDRSDKTDKSDKSDRTYTTYRTYQTYLDDPEQAANAMITLINQTTYLLDQQLKAVHKQREEKGLSMETYSQRIGRIFNAERKKQKEFDQWLQQNYGPKSN